MAVGSQMHQTMSIRLPSPCLANFTYKVLAESFGQDACVLFLALLSHSAACRCSRFSRNWLELGISLSASTRVNSAGKLGLILSTTNKEHDKGYDLTGKSQEKEVLDRVLDLYAELAL
jgi:hypothetical protein